MRFLQRFDSCKLIRLILRWNPPSSYVAIDPDPKAAFYENVKKAARMTGADVGLYRELSYTGLATLMLDDNKRDDGGFDLM